MTLVATSKDQAQELLGPARSAIKRAPVLKQYVESDSQQRIRLTTQRNKELGLGSESGILVSSNPCSAKSLRGPANILALLEEYGQYNWELRGSDKNDKSIYTAIAPSTKGFVDPIRKTPDGMIMVLSTPLTKESHMATLEDDISTGRTKNGLVLWMPTYWLNPLILPEEYHAEHDKDPYTFTQEYEGEYLESVEAAFPAEIVEACRNDYVAAALQIQRYELTFMGFDLGLKNDGTASAIVAVNENGDCRLIFKEIIRVGYGHWQDYAMITNEGKLLEELDIKKIAARVDYLFDYYGCMGGAYDQWNAYGLKACLTSRAREALTHVEFNPTNNDRVARNMVAMFNQKRVIIYANEEEWDDEDGILLELIRLQRIQTAGNPPKIKIQASNIRGRHDDQYSALSRALWAAKIGTEENVIPSSSGTTPIQQRIAASLREKAEILRSQRNNRSTSRPTNRGGRRW